MMIRCSMLQVRYLVRLRSFEPTVPQILSCRIAKPLKGITDCRPDIFFFHTVYTVHSHTVLEHVWETYTYTHLCTYTYNYLHIYNLLCMYICNTHIHVYIHFGVLYLYIYIYISTRVHTDNVFAFRTMAETMQTVCTPKKRHMLQNLEKWLVLYRR